MLKVTAAITAILAALCTLPAEAQTPVRIRGVIEQVDDKSIQVRSRDGQSLTVKLAPTLVVVAISKAALADIKQGTFVGAAAVRQADGTFKAQEVLVFPESMRGTGEGHYPWDLTPDSTMTNATVDALVSQVSGPILTLKYKDNEVKVAVPTDAPIVTIGPGDRGLLKPGAAVFVPAQRAADGSLSAVRVLVGTDGTVPPM